jgi:mannosyltransferase
LILTRFERVAASGSPDRQRLGGAEIAFVAALVVVAGVIRAIGLGDRPMWLDEAFSRLYAQLDLRTLIDLRRQGTNPPLYHLLLGMWSAAFGTSEAALRSLSVVAGTACVAAVYDLGRSMGGRSVGALAALLLCINSMAVGYSQEARYYALTELLAVLATLLLRKVVASRGALWTVSYAVLMSAFVWMHTFAWFVLVAHAIAVMIGATGRRFRGTPHRGAALRFGLATAVVCASFLPWAGILGSQVQHVMTRYWIPRPDAETVAATAHAFVAPLAEIRWWIVGACCVLLVLLVSRVVRRRRARVDRRSPAVRLTSLDIALLWSWAIVPIAIPLLWSWVGTPIYQVKYALAAQPAWMILLAVLVLRRPSLGLAAVALVTAVHAPAPHRGLQVEDWRHAAAVVRSSATPGTPVYVCQDFTYYGLTPYLDPNTWRITPVVKHGAEVSEFDRIFPRPAISYDAWLRRIRNEDNRAVVVLSRMRTGADDRAFREMIDDLRASGTVRLVDVEGDVDVALWVRQRRAAS